jgi:hypothetical protein
MGASRRSFQSIFQWMRGMVKEVSGNKRPRSWFRLYTAATAPRKTRVARVPRSHFP